MDKLKGKSATLRKVLYYIGRYKPLLIVSLILAAVSSALTLYVPILIGRAVDLIVDKGNVNISGIIPILIKAAVLVLATGLLVWLMNDINNRITYGVVRDVRRAAFDRLTILPLSYLDTVPGGDLVSRVITDADQFADGLLMGFTQLFSGVVTIVGTLIFMLTIHPLIALVVVLLTPLSLLTARYIANSTYSLFEKQSKTRGEQTAFIDEMIGGQKLVRSFVREPIVKEQFNDINDRLEKTSRIAIFYSSLVNPTTRFINGVVYAAVALAGALSVLSGSMSVGGLTCFLSYANQYTKPFNEISGVVTELQNALACASRLFELIEQPPRQPDKEDADVLSSVTGHVKAEDVCFSYVPEKPLIEGLNIDVKPGQRIAIVGPTGCGKTTIINLLMRFYDVNGGCISVEGIDIRDITRRSLRSGYGMVLQDTWLKPGTVRENILLGKPDATEDEMLAASKQAHCHGFVTRLPNGYDTLIGEGGSDLSQGQKQLLCIARVMLCTPPMLILDEATSSIDTRTEMKIQQAFEQLMEGRTSFIVAHRLSTIREADLILVMDKGHIIEQGNHNELLAIDGFYAKLYNSQFS